MIFFVTPLQLSLTMFSNPQLSFPSKGLLIFNCVPITDFVAAGRGVVERIRKLGAHD